MLLQDTSSESGDSVSSAKSKKSVKSSSQSSSTSEQPRRARKSTGMSPSTPSIPSGSVRRQTRSLSSYKENSENFLENFDPETSLREKNKLIKRINSAANKKPFGARYDEKGIHIPSGIDLCDCLDLNCPGCFFPCHECKSTKCGSDCRVYRKFIYESIEYHGIDEVVRNPLLKQKKSAV